MDKTIQIEIVNEYKSQISELEENLALIGQFEADAQMSVAFKPLTSFINFIFSWSFLFIGIVGLFAIGFYYTESLSFIDEYFKLGIDSPFRGKGIQFLKYVMIGLCVLCILLSALLKTIRSKNFLISSLGDFVNDFKMRSVRMHDQAKERLKNYHKLIAEDRFVNRN
jgi:hypothetical protein